MKMQLEMDHLTFYFSKVGTGKEVKCLDSKNVSVLKFIPANKLTF